MKKSILCIITSLVISLLSICLTFSVSAESADPLLPYKQRLEYLNKSYDLNYMIPNKTANDGDYSEIISFFSNMSLTEFDNYILSLINVSDNINSDNSQQYDYSSAEKAASTRANNFLQRYFYSSSNYNYFYIYTNTSYSDGYQRYNSVNSINSVSGSYPSFKLTGKSWSFTNNYRNISVTFKAQKYVSATVCYATTYTIPVTFSASGGDIRQSISL